MVIDPYSLQEDLDRLEDIERASLRLVVQALLDYRDVAVEIFREETDLPADIGEDITREALDRLGMARIDQRLFGKIDYKRARYLFHPEYAVKQALFVDSKAEKVSGQSTATLQTSQLSMMVRQFRAGQEIAAPGSLPAVLHVRGEAFITTTMFVKYNYETLKNGSNILRTITAAALPNGFLQGMYNPTAEDTIWVAGRDAPTLGEAFRVRLSFSRLWKKRRWRVQSVPMSPVDFTWRD